MSSLSTTRSMSYRNRDYILLRTPDELLADITVQASQQNHPLSASLSSLIRDILNQAIVLPAHPQDPPTKKRKLCPPEKSTRVHAPRRKSLYSVLSGGAGRVRRGPPQDLNMSFSLSNEDPIFQELLPQVDQATYDSAGRRADRRQAAQEAAEQTCVASDAAEARKVAEKAQLDFDVAEARELQAKRDSREAAKRTAAKLKAIEAREASSALIPQPVLEAFKFTPKDAVQTNLASDIKTTLKDEPKTASKGEQSATSGAKEHAMPGKASIIKPKNKPADRTRTLTPSQKPTIPSRLSQIHSAYTDLEWENLHGNTNGNTTSTLANTSNDETTTMTDAAEQWLAHTEPAIADTGAATFDIDIQDTTIDIGTKDDISNINTQCYINDIGTQDAINGTQDTVIDINTQDAITHNITDCAKEPVDIITDINVHDAINDSINTQTSVTEGTLISSVESESSSKAPSPPPFYGSAYGTDPITQYTQYTQTQRSSSTVAASISRIIKKAVGASRHRHTQTPSPSLAQQSNSRDHSQSSSSTTHATANGPRIRRSPTPSSTLGKRTQHPATDAVEPELKKTKSSQ
ncbi:hypothetical protein J1614_005878 [Plenodomus biglobosus]|nr:hypothetical protein J1614_005878 [Plenodomus biglobosus]